MELITQLRAVRSRYEEISLRLQDPAAISDNARYRALMKDYKNLTPIVEAYDAVRCWTQAALMPNCGSWRRRNIAKTAMPWRS